MLKSDSSKSRKGPTDTVQIHHLFCLEGGGLREILSHDLPQVA